MHEKSHLLDNTIATIASQNRNKIMFLRNNVERRRRRRKK